MNTSSFRIPNLCRNSAILTIIVVVELAAILITLLREETLFFRHLGLNSLYLLWVVLPATFLLCLFKKNLNNGSFVKRLIGLAACIVGPFLLTELAAQQVMVERVTSSFFNLEQLFSRLLILAILLALVVRWFTILGDLESRNKAEMQQRFQALQSRIQPHFLFNSLNTITELITIDPAHAENAIESLALLFRVNLETQQSFHSLEAELNLCRRYLELERWRLGKKLVLNMHVDVSVPSAYAVPKLLLQPLIENAVVHGGDHLGAVDLRVDIRETKKELSINMTNSKSEKSAHRAGNGVSTDNIKARLLVLYDDKAYFRTKETESSYDVLLRIPKQPWPMRQ